MYVEAEVEFSAAIKNAFYKFVNAGVCNQHYPEQTLEQDYQCLHPHYVS